MDCWRGRNWLRPVERCCVAGSALSWLTQHGGCSVEGHLGVRVLAVRLFGSDISVREPSRARGVVRGCVALVSRANSHQDCLASELRGLKAHCLGVAGVQAYITGGVCPSVPLRV